MKVKNKLSEICRVDHAGEYGAMRIYAGQLSVLKNTASYAIIKEMLEQEEEHLAFFESEIQKRRVRPTILLPLWHIGGFALGAATALIGEKAAMACTVAVEEVIGEHYGVQEKELEALSKESDLKRKISQFKEDELEHREIGLQNNAEQSPGYEVLTSAVRSITKTAIWLSKRI